MKGLLCIIFLVFSTATFANSYNCDSASVDLHPRLPFNAEVKIAGKEVQVKMDKRIIYFSNYDGIHAWSGDKSFAKGEKDGELFFLLSFWKDSIEQSVKEKKQSTMDVILVDCALD